MIYVFIHKANGWLKLNEISVTLAYYKLYYITTVKSFIRLGPDLNGVWAEGGKPDGQRRLSVSAFALLPFPFVPVVLQGSSVDTADRTADGDPVLKQKQIQRSSLSFKDTFARGHQIAWQRDFKKIFHIFFTNDGGNMHACVNTT